MRASRRVLFASLLLSLALGATLATAKKPAINSGLTERERAIHALNRLTFGVRPGDIDHVLSAGVDKWIDEQLHPDRINDSALQSRLARYGTLKMSTRELAERFPPPQVIKAVANGLMDMPRDPKLRAVYESQIEGYRFRELKKSSTTGAGNAEAIGDADPMMDPDERSQSRELALLKAASLQQLPPDERFRQILQMPADERRTLFQSMPEGERYKLIADLKPEQRETLMAMRNPLQAVETELQQAKLLRAIYSERQLDEVMTDFWFNHFNVYLGKAADRYLVTSYERDVIRPHALGKFKDLLRATADSPAMLFYLDNWLSVGPNSAFAQGMPARGIRPLARRVQQRRQQNLNAVKNRRSGLNENYARELMELHTLGVNGGYTQKDVTEGARVFTGWTLKEPRRGGSYEFNERMHEPGTKIVLGHKIKEHGEDEGRQVLDILARHPSTARFIATKLALRFVSDTPSQPLVDRMTKTFLDKDGDIREVLKTMFSSPEFWAPDMQRAKVKTPLEFVASAVRATGADVADPLPLVATLNRMGMPLYGAQPPTGYSMKADAWVNSAALLNRLNFALGLAAGKVPGTSMDSERVLHTSATSAVSDPNMQLDNTLSALEATLVAGKISQQTHESIRKQMLDSNKSNPLNLALGTGLILGSPEFQRR